MNPGRSGASRRSFGIATDPLVNDSLYCFNARSGTDDSQNQGMARKHIIIEGDPVSLETERTHMGNIVSNQLRFFQIARRVDILANGYAEAKQPVGCIKPWQVLPILQPVCAVDVVPVGCDVAVP